MTTVLYDLDAVVTMVPTQTDPLGVVGFGSPKIAYIVFSNGKITTIGTGVPPSIEGGEYISLPGLTAVHGGIYGHNHSFQHGLLHRMWGLPIDKWLFTMASLALQFTPEIYYYQAYASFAKAALGGVTHIVDFPYFGNVENAHAIIKAATDVGVRLTLVWGVIDDRKHTDYPQYPSLAYQTIKRYLADVDSLVTEYTSNTMVRFSLGPCTPFNATQDLFTSCQEYVRSMKGTFTISLHTHWAETQWEVDRVYDRYGLTMSSFLQSVGWWENLPVTLGHGIEISSADIQFLAEHGQGVVRCPRTDNRAKPRVSPMRELFELNVPVGIGADGDPMLPSFQLATEARWLKTTNPPPRELRWDHAWRMLTSEGARAIHWDEGGQLAPGKVADIALYDMNELPLQGGDNPFSAMVFEQTLDPHWVWCNGKLIAKRGQLVQSAKSYRDINQHCARLILPLLQEM